MTLNQIILRTATRLLHPLILFFSFILLAQGHDAPGGGFAAGLTASASFILVALVEGPRRARRALHLDPRTTAGLGLLVALVSGLPGLVSQGRFGAARWTEVQGSELGTPLLFELGVYLVVLGVALMLVLFLLEE